MYKIFKLIIALLCCYSIISFSADQSLTYYRDFWSPRYHGELLDYCFFGKKNCGMEVANQYCKLMGYKSAKKSLLANNVGLTRYIDGCEKCSNSKCKGWNCDGFKMIRCSNDVDHTPPSAYYYRERIYVLPRMDKYRVAWCYEDGKGCGKKVANSFCRRMGYSRSSAYTTDTEIHASREIGNGKLCFGDQCRGFSSITCYR